MLKNIWLKQFGMFRDARFDLSGVTVFLGENQSGKTTVFEAIRMEGFSPDKRSNRRLYARYGEDTQAELTWSMGPPEISDDTFMNLFAVGRGQMEVDFEGSWVNVVKRNLFAGGLDPDALEDEFAKRASEKGTLKHNRQAQKLEKEQKEILLKKREKEARRAEILAGLAGQKKALTEMDAGEGHLANTTAQEAALAAEAERLEDLFQRGELEQRLSWLHELESLKLNPNLEKPEALHAHLEEQEEEKKKRESERQATTGKLNLLNEQISAGKAKKGEMEANLAQKKNWEETARALLKEIPQKNPGKKVALMAVLLGVVLSGAGVVIWVGNAWGLWVLAGGLVLAGMGGIAWNFSGGASLGEFKDRWRNTIQATDDPLGKNPLDAQTLGGFQDGIDRVLRDIQTMRATLENTRESLKNLEAEQAEAQNHLGETGAKLEQTQSTLRVWLHERGYDSKANLIQGLTEEAQKKKKKEDLTGKLEELLNSGGFSDIASFRSDAEHRIKSLDEKGVGREKISSDELTLVRKKLGKIRLEKEKQTSHLVKLDRAQYGEEKKWKGLLEGLPEEIAELAEKQRKLEEEAHDLTQDRLAAGRAREIFKAIADDGDAGLIDLSASVAKEFAQLTGLDDGGSGVVEIQALSKGDLVAQDKWGVNRPLEDLSSGARQLFLLALRLEMAKRARPEGYALLSLDEPFAYLDPQRLKATMNLLKEFIEKMEWQLVFFTNEPSQADLARKVFPDCTVHNLPFK